MKESPTLEFKRELTEAVKKEVIAFANTQGGTLYIGIEDDGNIVGVTNAHKVLESASNMLHDGIQPDILVHTLLEIETIQNKEVIKISVTRGNRRPYHIKGKGMKPAGVFIRYGTSVTNASEEAIRQMILESDGTHYEAIRSLYQDLTFLETEKIFTDAGLKFEQEQKRTLKLITEDGHYTNLALLLSDQCPHTIRCAHYVGDDKLHFQDRKEFHGSILYQIESAYAYMNLFNETSSTFEGLKRIEQEAYPSYAIREGLINAVVHRDYSFSGSTLIHIFQNRIEMVSVGGLVKGLTLADIELGVSQSRNPAFANVLYRLKWIESYGTGIQRIKESYKHSENQPFWQVGPNAFVLTLPKQEQTLAGDSEKDEISSWLQKHPEFTARELENELQKSKSAVRLVIDHLIQEHRIERVGKGPKTKYRVK